MGVNGSLERLPRQPLGRLAVDPSPSGDVDGLRWITTLRAPTIRKLIKAGEVAQTMFDERDLVEMRSPEYPGERLIVCRNPILAEQRQRKRQELLASTEKELMPIVTALQGGQAFPHHHHRRVIRKRVANPGVQGGDGGGRALVRPEPLQSFLAHM